MIVTVLVENSTISKEYKNRHGLCLHIKAKNYNILFDLGPDEIFIKNANKLGIDISDVDIVIISHGHKDHGGGLSEFFKYNNKAKIYINKNAFDEYYTKIIGPIKYYVGLNRNLKNNNRIIFTGNDFAIDDSIHIFSDVNKQYLMPSSNKVLFMKEEGQYKQDFFKHEQNLILKEDNKYILIAGCAHNGIINIIDKAKEIVGKDLDFVISGFHLYNPVSKKRESSAFIDKLSMELSTQRTKFYTCHCTGNIAFKRLKNNLEDKIDYLSSGQIINL